MERYGWGKKSNDSGWDSLLASATEKLEDVPPDHKECPLMPDSYDAITKIAKKEFASFMDPFVKNFSEGNIREIDSAFDVSYVAGNEVAVDIFADLLHIKRPDVAYIPERQSNGERTLPCYDQRTGKIYIPNRQEDDDSIVNKVDKIAHEMWHAYQHQTIKNNGRRSDIYRNNFANYRPPERGVKEYFCQPVELEAYTFGSRIIDKFFTTVLYREIQECEQGRRAIAECRENGNEHLIDLFEDVVKKRQAKIDKMKSGSYFKKNYGKRQNGNKK